MMRRLLFCVLATLCIAGSEAGAAELYDWNGQSIDITVLPTWPAPPGLRKQPVLFVHGHAADTSSDPNYKKNFWEDADDDPFLAFFDLTSFKKTLDDTINSGLDIEPYYIRFADRTRSITDDAFDIGEAVDYIIRRHNENFDPTTATMPPPVQIAIIGYSKGTLSTRQYLKSLQQQVQDNGGISLPLPRPGYRPVPEFIAIAPPNHGLAVSTSSAFGDPTDQISVQQLYNGVRPQEDGCGAFNPLHPQAANFIEILNGETALDSQVSNAAPAPAEAPGSRASNQGPHRGTLYVTLFDNRDFVGGGSASTTDCVGAGRALASNLSSDAINIPIGIPGSLALTIHRNTVHTQDVICKALFAAAHHRSPENQTCALSGRVPIIPVPQPAAAMLALDISGSMLARQCAMCPTRYDILEQAVEIFAQLWSQAGRPNDRLGVTYFRTMIDEPLIGNERLPVLAGNVATLAGHVNGQNVVPFNLTAMGGGLQRSVEALRALPADQAEARHVILFSDGMQNVNPMVLPPQHVTIDNETGRPSSGVSPTGMRLDALSPLRIDTIAVGAGAFVNVLSDIAAHGRGLSRPTLDANDLRQFFVEELIDALRTTSPQLIGYRRGTLRGTSATESFLVNRGARKLLFKVSWQRGQRLDVRAFKDGVDMTSSARVVAGEFYRILAINPSKGARDPASGEWRLRISGKPDTAYEAAAIIDDKELRYQARLERLDGQAGAMLALAVQVDKERRPIDGPITVTATMTRPRVAIGNVLAAMKPLRPGSRGSEPGMTEAERRVAAFLQDQKQRDALRPVTETIRLDGDNRGGFRAVLANASVPGLHRVEVRIAGEDRQLGRFERSQTVTAMVRFGEADRARSALTLRTLPRNQGIELTLRPADRRGNLLGPTFASHIALALSAGKIERGPEDLGDGRYRFVLSPARGQDPTLTLAVMGRPLFTATIKELRDVIRR
jgi:hypothetical protein